MNYSIYELLWLFSIYAFLGWCVEVIFATITRGKFVNSGFLNGPVCPIYGFGVITVILLLTPIKNNMIIFFFGSVLLTTILELITGFALKKVFNQKWWDYSDRFLNFKGYICLKFSVLWGIGCVLVIDILQPVINTFVKILPKTLGIGLFIIIFLIFILDTAVTVIELLKIKKFLYLADEIEKKMNLFSNTLGEGVSESVEAVIKVKNKGANELEEMVEHFESFTKKEGLAFERLIKAYPRLKLVDGKEFLKKTRGKLESNSMKEDKNETKIG